MPQNRRSFIKKFGVTLGSLTVSGALPGCGPRRDAESPETESRAQKNNRPSPNVRVPSAPEWEQLGRCWISLRTLNEDFEKATPNRDQFKMMDAIETINSVEKWHAVRDAIPKERIARHQALLHALVTADQLEESVARHMQTAFEEAVHHIVRSMSTCYAGLAVGYAPREDLLHQTSLLNRIWCDLDPVTVARARAAIAQDIAFFEIIKTDASGYYSFADSYVAGDLKASPEALEAAHLLTQLLLETPD